MEATTRKPALALALVALALLAALPAPAAAEIAPVEGPVDGPHLLIEVTNEADEDQTAQLRIEETGNETVLFDEQRTFPAGQTTTLRFPVPPGPYGAEVYREERTGAMGVGYSLRMSGAAYGDLRGCPGAYRLELGILDGGVWGNGGGCLAEPPHFQALVTQAEAASTSASSGIEVEVPLPGQEDRGRYTLSDDLRAPNWTEAEQTLPFAWRQGVTFPDAWGREVTGAELRFTPSSSSWGSGGSGPWDAGTVVTNEDVPHGLRFQDGHHDPLARSRMVSTYARTSSLASSAEGVWEINYHDTGELLPCLFRNALQGTTLATGDTVQPDCPGLEAATFRAGRPVTHLGIEALPLYHLRTEDSGARTVTRLLVAGGIPYPLGLERFTAGGGNRADHDAYGLTHLALEGDPLPDQGPVLTDRTLQLAPLDPLDGPTLTSHADRFGLTLEEASQAARANPALTDLQALLKDPEAVLAGAVLAPERDATETTETRLVWTLAYTAPGRTPVLVDCYRDPHPTTAGALETGQAPVAVCQDHQDDGFGPRWALSTAPPIGASDLPGRGAGFDLAIDRWAEVDPGNASAPVTSVVYQAWPADDDERRPYLAVGTHAGSDTTDALSSEGVATSLAVDLETGASYAERRTLRRAQALGGDPAPLAEAGSVPSPPTADAGELPLLVGTAAGALGLIGLIVYLLGPGKGFLWALYTRLTRPDVLDHPVRREIIEIVRADPGVHAEEIKRQLSGNGRTAEYHLDVLVREDFLATVETDGYTHFFERGTRPVEEMQALAHLRHGQAAAVFQAICEHPGSNLSAVARAAGVSTPYASKLVAKLQGVGLVDKVRDGRSVTIHPRQATASQRS